MRHRRADYSAIQAFPQKREHWVRIDGETVLADDSTLGKHMDPIIPEDEPVFLLRSMDKFGPDLVRRWANELGMAGGPVDLQQAVLEWADEMEAYAVAHGGAKVPDTDPALL